VKVLGSGGSAPVVFKPGGVQRCVASFTLQERLSVFSLKIVMGFNSCSQVVTHPLHSFDVKYVQERCFKNESAYEEMYGVT
jgi:hypothetical protein